MANSDSLAKELASCAREALALIACAGTPDLLRFQDGFGIPHDGANHHAFRAALAQSLFYGLFAAWDAQGRPDSVDWRTAPVMFGRRPDVALFEGLGADAALDRACLALGAHAGAVGGNATEHFYPAFLREFDPESKVNLGVHYTPAEIVRYQIDSADRILREDLGVEDGFADPRVRILDPCCGTGAYVIGVLRKIAETAGAEAAKRAALERIGGFEIMPASFLAAQWRIGDFLAGAGAPLAMDERPRIRLASAMPDGNGDGALGLMEQGGVQVVIGNPPYNAFAGHAPPEIGELIRPYAERSRDLADSKRVNMHDLYVRFFRVAEMLAAEADRGLVSFIANHSWVAAKSFTGMRHHLMETFDRAWIDEMCGSVFKIDGFADGVKQGVAIAALAKTGGEKSVLHRKIPGQGAAARAQLADGPEWRRADPAPSNLFSLAAHESAPGYFAWPSLRDLTGPNPGCHNPGAQEGRSGSLFGFDREDLERRMREYHDPAITWEDLEKGGNGMALPKAGYRGPATRKRAVEEGFDPGAVRRYAVRPFDLQWAYVSPIPNVWNSRRGNMWRQAEGCGRWLISRGSQKGELGMPAFPSTAPCDLFFMSADSCAIPMIDHDPGDGLFGGSTGANLSERAAEWLEEAGGEGEDLWLHALAVCASPAYMAENRECLAMGEPRIPLPRGRAALRESARLGSILFDLLAGDGGKGPAERMVPNPGGGRLAGWGSLDGEGSVQASRRNFQTRPWTGEEADAIAAAAESEGVEPERAMELLGDAVDVPMDAQAPGSPGWIGIPSGAWSFRVGKHQVIRKWLAYRDADLIGRDIGADEAAHVSSIARSLAVLLLMTDRLDASYLSCRDFRL